MDIKLLKDDIKFPLSWGDIDYKIYILDADKNMIAQVMNDGDIDSKHPFEKLIGDFKKTYVHPHPKYYSLNGEFYDVFNNSGRPIGLVRGLGIENDNIIKYILNVINN